jgi:uncharacterized protein
LRAAKLALAALLALAVAAGAAETDEPRIPAPRGFVNDFAGVLDPGTVAHLEKLIGELRSKTGSEIAVVTVRSTKPLGAFDYAMKIAEAWKPGAKGKDNGVVFLVAVADRELFIVTGYGIEGALPDGRVGEIRDTTIVPRFRAGDMPGGIRAGTEALAAIIAREYGVSLQGAREPPRTVRRRQQISPVTIILLLILVVFIVRSGLWPVFFQPPPHMRRRYGRSFGGGGFGGYGGGFGGGGGGGFGGFGGGGFGGGGAGGRW